MLYLISYNASMAQETKTRIENTLLAMQGWWRYLDTTWIVTSEQSLEDITNRIHNVAGTDDKFIVVDITFDTCNGWLPSRAWTWLQDANINERDRILRTNALAQQQNDNNHGTTTGSLQPSRRD